MVNCREPSRRETTLVPNLRQVRQCSRYYKCQRDSMEYGITFRMGNSRRQNASGEYVTRHVESSRRRRTTSGKCIRKTTRCIPNESKNRKVHGQERRSPAHSTIDPNKNCCFVKRNASTRMVASSSATPVQELRSPTHTGRRYHNAQGERQVQEATQAGAVMQVGGVPMQ